MRLMHIADLHLGAPMRHLKDAAAQRRRDRESAFPRIIEAAMDKADLLVISGDLFDTHDPGEDLVAMVRSQLKKLRSSGVEVILVPGNHDEITYSASTYNEAAWDSCCTMVRCPRPEAVMERQIAGEKVFICSCAYTGGITKASDLSELPRVPEGSFGLLALHGSVDMDFPGTREDRAMRASSQEIERAGYSYAAMGHIHKRLVKKQGGLTIAYPGIIDPMEFGDGATGEYLLADIEGGDIKVRWQALDGLDLYAEVLLDATGLTPEQAAEEIKKRADGAKYLKARLTGTVPAAFSVDSVAAILRPDFTFVEIEDAALKMDMGELSMMAEENSARGIFVKRMLHLMQSEVSEGDALLEAALKKGLEALRQEAGK